MVGYYKMTEETPHPKKEMLFSFPAISWTMVLLYHVVTFVRLSGYHLFIQQFVADGI